MYKQCFELLTAQGPKPHKSFSVAQGSSGEVLKEFDQEIKGNIFSLNNQRIQLPPNPSQINTDFHNTGTTGTKKVGVTQSLNIVHQFLVFQIFVAQSGQFSIELHVRDKSNSRRRLMFCDGTKNIVTNQMHARFPNTMVVRDRWVNLCIDVNSFIKECFSRTSQPHNTPQVQGNQQSMMVNGSKAAIGGGSGDMAALHSGKAHEIKGVHTSKAAAIIAKNVQSSASSSQNSMKTIEVIQLEGCFKIRKIFTSRSQIPADILIEQPFGFDSNVGGTSSSMQVNTMRAEDLIQAAMSGQRLEQIPKNFDFNPLVERVSQVLSFEGVSSFMLTQQQMDPSNIDQMNGLRMTVNTQNSFQNSNEDAPNDTYMGTSKQAQGATPYPQGNYLQPGSIKSGTKTRGTLRVSSNDRKQSVDGDSNSMFPQGGVVGSTIGLNHQLDGSFRLDANQSKQTQNSVVVVDQEANEQARIGQNSGMRSSGISIRQGGPANQRHLHVKTSNATGESVFKQANSAASVHGQRSNQTQSTAYSVRTTSSGHQKGKLSNGGSNLQTSQSPFTDNNSGGGGATASRKRSLHASNGQPVYEQVDEMEESGSGHISLRLGEKQQTQIQDNRGPGKKLRMNSPQYSSEGTQVAQSAKVQRKGTAKTNVDTTLPFSNEKMQILLKQDPMTTPKLSQLQEVHQTTILEENETLRGSIDRNPGSKLGLNQIGGNGSNNQTKQSKRVQAIDSKKVAGSANHKSAAGSRKVNGSYAQPKNVRAKSNVGGNADQHQQQRNNSSNSNLQQNPLVRGSKAAGKGKGSVSSTNLEDSIGGVVGSKIQSRQGGAVNRKQTNKNNNNHNAIVSPNVARKTALPKNQLQLSAQRKRGDQNQQQSSQPQFQVRNTGGTKSNKNNQFGGGQHQNNNNNQAAFIYNGTGYGSNNHNNNTNNQATATGHLSNLLDSADGEQNDFKTTTLRFTNNNFINAGSASNAKERDSSQGAAMNNNTQQNQHNMNGSLLNTLNSQNNQVQQHIAKQQMSGQRNSKQFGTSDNFKATGGGYQNGKTTTDGFNRLQNNQSKSPTNNYNINQNRQFSTMHGMMQSDGPDGHMDDDPEEEEEMIEEDICANGESPHVHGQNKHQTGQKAKVLFHGQQPPMPMFRSTDSDNFNMDTMMTGFGHNKGQVSPYANNKDKITPIHDKSSILAKKPYLGGKPRHQLVKSPNDRSPLNYDFQSAGGGIGSEMRHQIVNQKELQKDIEEEIRYEQNMNAMEDSTQNNIIREGRAQGGYDGEIDPNDTCTSDFYQVPIQGGIPVQLTIENGRRPFTPPFAGLVKVNSNKPPTGKSGSRAKNPNQKMPEWVKPVVAQNAEGTKLATVGGAQVMSKEQKNELEREIIQEGEEEPIEEEIEGANISPNIRKQKAESHSSNEKAPSTTKDSSSEVASRNKKDPHQTFVEEQIEFSESFKNRDSQHQAIKQKPNLVSGTHENSLDDHTGSKSHTFGRRSLADAAEEDDQENDNDQLDRLEPTIKTQKKVEVANQQINTTKTQKTNDEQDQQSYYQRDVIDPNIVDQKKRLLYDKSLKAYYDPETGHYFEMKAQLIPQSSLGQIDPLTNNVENQESKLQNDYN